MHAYKIFIVCLNCGFHVALLFSGDNPEICVNLKQGFLILKANFESLVLIRTISSVTLETLSLITE